MAERGTNKILIGYLCAIGTEIIFGMSYIFTKQAPLLFSGGVFSQDLR